MMDEDSPAPPIKRVSGLGRGLSALLGDLAPASAVQGMRDAGASIGPSGTATMLLPLAQIRPNPGQPRRSFDDAAMAELVDSIRERGVLQPILVRRRRLAGDYEIVAGERRWRAAQAAQLHEIPVVLMTLDDTAAFEVAIIENIQRADLNPVEEADGYRRLIVDFGRTQEDIARIVGKSRSHVANILRLTQISPALRAHVAEGRLTLGHIKALLAADPGAQEALAERAVTGGLTVRQTEALAAGKAPVRTRPAASRPSATPSDPDLLALETMLADSIGLPVEIVPSGGGGAVTIGYASLEQLDGLIARLSA